jgi:subtilisin family serine protease
MLDQSLPFAGIGPTFHHDTNLNGQGVLIGVIDTGIDWRHEDFWTDGQAAPTTRIERLFDLSLPPLALRDTEWVTFEGAQWGREALEMHLLAERQGTEPANPVRSEDIHGHGTHVASAAAGAHGVAPEASLVVVKAAREDWPIQFHDTDVLESARLIFDVAHRAARPCVLLLALGGHHGGHDGSSWLERGLAELVGPDFPGRAIVVAAGNSGHGQDHAGGELSLNEPIELVLGSQDETLTIDLEIWRSSAGREEVTIEVTTPAGESIRADRMGRLDDRNVEFSTASANITIGFPASESNGSDLHEVVSLTPPEGGHIQPGTYLVHVEGQGRFDAYLSWWSRVRGGTTPRLASPLEPDGTLTVPATAPELLVVGATVSREAWRDEGGRLWDDLRYRTNKVAPYSGSGPTRSGYLKPDLVAPGHAVVAALSRHAQPDRDTSLFASLSPYYPERYMVTEPGNRAAMWGTSVAAAHAAGVVALLLQLDPDLTQLEIRSLLVASARRDATRPLWNPRHGFGELDAAAAVHLYNQGLGQGRADAGQTTLGTGRDVLPPGDCTTVTVLPRNSQGDPMGPHLRVEVTDGMGQDALLPSTDGVYQGTYCIEGNAPLGSRRYLEATVAGEVVGVPLVVHVAHSRRQVGAEVRASGGCGVAPPGQGGLLRLLRGLLGHSLWSRLDETNVRSRSPITIKGGAGPPAASGGGHRSFHLDYGASLAQRNDREETSLSGSS